MLELINLAHHTHSEILSSLQTGASASKGTLTECCWAIPWARLPDQSGATHFVYNAKLTKGCWCSYHNCTSLYFIWRQSIACSVMPTIKVCTKLKVLKLVTRCLSHKSRTHNAAELLNFLPMGLTSLDCSGFRLYISEHRNIKPVPALQHLHASFCDGFFLNNLEDLQKVCMQDFSLQCISRSMHGSSYFTDA